MRVHLHVTAMGKKICPCAAGFVIAIQIKVDKRNYQLAIVMID